MALKFYLALLVLGIVACTSQGRLLGKQELDFSGYCSDDTIPPGSSFWQSLNMTMTDIIKSTPSAPGLTFTVKHGRDDATAYGQGMCFNLPPGGCEECISMLVKRAWTECSNSIAAMLVLTGKCAVRYQDTPFGPGAPPPPKV